MPPCLWHYPQLAFLFGLASFFRRTFRSRRRKAPSYRCAIPDFATPITDLDCHRTKATRAPARAQKFKCRRMRCAKGAAKHPSELPACVRNTCPAQYRLDPHPYDEFHRDRAHIRRNRARFAHQPPSLGTKIYPHQKPRRDWRYDCIGTPNPIACQAASQPMSIW